MQGIMMKVLIVNSVYKNGSTGGIVFNLHSYLQNNDVESYVIYGRGKKVNDNNVFKSSSELLSKVNVLRARLTGKFNNGNACSTKKIIRKIKIIKPEIVHLHNLNDQFVNVTKLLKFLSKNHIKTLITLHSEQMYTGSCGYALECEKWMNEGCHNCEHLLLSTGSKVDKTKYTFQQLKEAYKDFKELQFTAVSNWLAERASQSKLLSSFNITTITNGVDTSIFNKHEVDNSFYEKFNLPKDKKIILFVNPRLQDEVKGHQFIEEISSNLPNDYCIVIVGNVPQGFIKSRKCIYVGGIYDRKVLSDFYNVADKTILLSKKETFSMIIAESLCCGTPVVSFKCGGPETCFSNDYVKFVEYGDAKTFIEIILSNGVNINKISSYGNKYFSLDAMCASYLTLYKKMQGIKYE